MKVKKLENSYYIVQNEQNNKVLKLGESEFKYLQALREKNGIFKSEFGMTEEQQRYLFQKFEELGFLGDETKKVKGKQNLSDVKLISFEFYEKLYNVLKILGCVVSPAGLMCNAFLGGVSLVIYIFMYLQGTYCKIFFYYFVFQFATIRRNILPFEKFDGYWMIVSISGIHNLYDKSIVLFFAMLRDVKGYIAIPVNYLKKIMLSLYGGINLLFRWIFWLYCIGALNRFVQNYISYWIPYVVVRILYTVIALNSIMFVRGYVKKYKAEGNRIIANL